MLFPYKSLQDRVCQFMMLNHTISSLSSSIYIHDIEFISLHNLSSEIEVPRDFRNSESGNLMSKGETGLNI